MVAPRTDRTPLLELQAISKRFGAVQALADARFDVFADEVVALVGDNGAGKSTLIKIISGFQKPDEGKLYVRGEENVVGSPSSSSSPSLCSCTPERILMSVDLPAPLSPSTQVTSPARTVVVIPSSAMTVP